MSEALVVGIVRQAIELAILVSLPMLLAGLTAGVAVSVLQTVTSIQDNVLAFIPRAAAIFITFALTFPWMLRLVSGFARQIVQRLPEFIRVIDLPPITRLAVLLVRPGFLVIAAPVFGGAYAPTLLKVGLTTIIAMSLIPLVPLPETLGEASLAVVVVREALIGLALGFAVRVIVAGAEFAGHLTGFQLGLTYASVVDPQSGVRNGVLSALYGTIALVVFFGIDAHHDLLRALVRSFEVLPVGAGSLGSGVGEIVMRLLGLVFVVGAQLAAPVVIVLLVAELALGLLSRVAPMLNLMAQGFAIRLLLGLLALAAMVHVIPGVIAGVVPRGLDLGVRLATAFR